MLFIFRVAHTTTVGLKAGRKGFEPLNGFYTVNRLAGGPNRPLWHLPIFPAFELLKTKAEEEGFEPPLACASTVFKTVAFVHSAIPPQANVK